MKLRPLLVTVVACIALAGFAQITVGTARAQTSNDCGQATTTASLVACVEHCAELGLINNQGVTNSLLAKLDAAQVAQDNGQTGTAINILHAFIQELHAQAGKHIDQSHAQDMATHAQMVILALGG